MIDRDNENGPPRLCPCRGVRSGSWESQGFPFFSGTAAYAADFTISGDDAGKRVFLDAGNVGHILEIEINGYNAGVRAWPPYRAEITRFVRFGEGNIAVLKVTNTLRNMLEGPDPQAPSGLLDDVWLELG
jgi:hypothetical protein